MRTAAGRMLLLWCVGALPVPRVPCPSQGLSHYLEHMLFMGSERYPDENDYDAFLTAHGGASNACTEEVSAAGGGAWLVGP